MADTYQDYLIQFTGDGHTLDLTITVDTSVTEKIDTHYSDDSGHPIVAVSGTFDGNAITGPSVVVDGKTLIGPLAVNSFIGNDNLYVASTEPQALDYSGVSFTANGVNYNLFYEVNSIDSGWTLDDQKSGPNHIISGAGVSFSITAVCFASGTLIRTTRGDVAVEDLNVGDLMVTASGEARPITWLGHRRIEHPTLEQQPVRIMAGAFGECRPKRDLFLSPGHAVCVDVMGEVFTPVGELVNGATIAQVEVPEVTYWHVELESHDVLLAEGLPTESYMDAGNRVFFGRDYGRLAQIDPEREARSLSRYARPFVRRGPIVEAIRQRLLARAEALNWTRSADLDLHMEVDGQRIEPAIDGDLARFIFPPSSRNAVLTSRAFAPAWAGQSVDRRVLGVMVKSIDITDGLRVDRRVMPDNPALDEGFHGLEQHGEEARRWTDGRGHLPAALWEGCKDQVILTIAFAPIGSGAWIAPESAPGVWRRAA